MLAHRGLLSADDPEIWDNTLASFAAAQAAGAEYIETDSRETADGDTVLFHDETLERLVDDPRPIAQVATAELREIFADHGGLLTVSEALEAFPTTRFNIDVKSDAVAGPIGRVAARHADRVLVTSFSEKRRRDALRAAQDAGARRPATSGGAGVIARLRALSALRLSPAGVLRAVDAVQIPIAYGRLNVLTPALLAAAHEHGVEVHVWTIDDVDEMVRLVALGVDGIVTDRADLALRALSPS